MVISKLVPISYSCYRSTKVEACMHMTINDFESLPQNNLMNGYLSLQTLCLISNPFIPSFRAICRSSCHMDTVTSESPFCSMNKGMCQYIIEGLQFRLLKI